LESRPFRELPRPFLCAIDFQFPVSGFRFLVSNPSGGRRYFFFFGADFFGAAFLVAAFFAGDFDLASTLGASAAWAG